MQIKRKYSRRKLTPEDVLEIRKKLDSGVSQIAISIRFDISQAAVSNIKLGRSWSHVC